MGFLQIIFFVITNLPTIIKLVRDLIGLISQIRNGKERNEMMAELRHGVKSAKMSGNFEPLERLHERLKAKLG
jgi:hypothetical protein